MAEAKFDLDSLLKISYEYEPLKKVLEYLLSRDKAAGNRLSKLEGDLETYKKDFTSIKSVPKFPTGPSMPEFVGVKDRLTKLEDRVYSHDERFAQHQTLIDATSFNLKMLQMSVSEHDEKLADFDKMKEEIETLKQRVDELESLLKGIEIKINGLKSHSGKSVGPSEEHASGTSIDLSSVEQLIANLKTELFKSFASKTDFTALLKRVESLESLTSVLNDSHEKLKVKVEDVNKQTNENSDEIAQLKERLKLLEQKLSNKVNCEEYDKLLLIINQLKSGSPAGSVAPSGPLLPSKDLNMLKELGEKVPDIELRLDSLFKAVKAINIKGLEDSIKDILSKLNLKADKKDLDALADLVKKLREEFDRLALSTHENTSEIHKLKGRLELLETKLTQLTRTLTELSGRIDKSRGKEPKDIFSQPQGTHIDEEEWNEMKKSLEKLKKDVADILKELDLLKDLKKRLFALEAAMEDKLDREEFERWKNDNDINQIVSGLLKKFADKNDMLKALKRLESRILVLEELMREGGPGMIDPGENAMLAKKPLGGWSCASCQKDLINIEGIKAQYHPWARLPQRNPTERIAKVGQGFSRMLSMLKPELITKSQQIGVMQKRNYEDDPRMTIEEEEGMRGMSRSHGQGFGTGRDAKRPSTASAFPNIQQAKVLY